MRRLFFLVTGCALVLAFLALQVHPVIRYFERKIRWKESDKQSRIIERAARKHKTWI